jgi:hypothetical protein
LQVADGTVDNWIAVVGPILVAVITRPKVTPAVNPGLPATIAVKADDAETPADLPPMALPPVRTLTGKHR